MSAKSKAKKEMTLGSLAEMMTKGFEESGKQLDKKLDKLATSIQGELLKLKEDIEGVKSDTEDIKADLNKKVDRFEHNGLVYRVEKLEKKFA